MTGSRRLVALRSAGIEFVAGVPCSYLAGFFAACQGLPKTAFLPAVREDHALAACAGAWLGGRRPLAAMQNSGLGYCLEVMASLHLTNRIPLPMLVSDRGSTTDYEEHRVLGQRTRSLLDLFGVPWRVAGPDIEEDAHWLVDTAEAASGPGVLLVGRDGDV